MEIAPSLQLHLSRCELSMEWASGVEQGNYLQTFLRRFSDTISCCATLQRRHPVLAAVDHPHDVPPHRGRAQSCGLDCAPNGKHCIHVDVSTHDVFSCNISCIFILALCLKKQDYLNFYCLGTRQPECKTFQTS